MHFLIQLVMCVFCNRHHQHGRWQARIGRVAGNKDLYLGTFSKSRFSFSLGDCDINRSVTSKHYTFQT